MDIVDGYNVLFRLLENREGEQRGQIRDERELLIDIVQGYADQMSRETILVFDAPKKSVPWFGEKEMSDYLTVMFSNREGDADELICKLVERESNPNGIVVVTSDRTLSRRTEREGATVEKSNHYLERIDVSLEEEVEKKHPGEPPEKYGQEPVKDVAGWLKFFGFDPE